MLVITYDKDNKEHLREEQPDDFRPLNGFERSEDGNYYKTLGDPRCISDELKRQIIIRESKKKEKENVDDTSVVKKAKLTIFSQIRVTPETIKKYSKNTLTSQAADGSVHTLYGTQMLATCGVYWFERFDKFAKMVLDTRSKTIELWYDDPNESIPDAMIANVLA